MSQTIGSAFSAEKKFSVFFNRNRAHTYGRWVLGAYVVFFAAVAPFICWGTISDPTHSHATAHFVFDEEVTAVNTHSSESHGHDYCQHDPALRHNRLAAAGSTAGAFPESETRSAPVVTLISLLVVLFFSIRETLFNPLRQLVRINFFIPAMDAIRLVPTPPPRQVAFL